jgi:N-methylhydantoinase A/oxoprolinase/acetone carboxylase beta subunit
LGRRRIEAPPLAVDDDAIVRARVLGRDLVFDHVPQNPLHVALQGIAVTAAAAPLSAQAMTRAHDDHGLAGKLGFGAVGDQGYPGPRGAMWTKFSFIWNSPVIEPRHWGEVPSKLTSIVSPSLVNASLVRAIRAVSTERGRDPGQFALFAFGGMGPAQDLDVAAELGIKRVIVPPLAGLFSALGLLFSEVQHHLVRTHYADMARPDWERMNAALAALAREAAMTLEREGFTVERRTLAPSADLRYRGQDHSLTVSLRDERLDPRGIAGLVEDFHRAHERIYGYPSDNEPVQVVAVRCLGRGLTDGERVPEHFDIAAVKGWRPSPARRFYFGPGPGWIETDVVGRAALGERPMAGPLIIEEDNALTVVPPNWKAHRDGWSNIVLEPG